MIRDGVAKGGLRLIVSMPPRHGKSELCSHWTPVWFLANWPNKRVILASYEATFAASWGRKVRNTLQENLGIGVRLSEDSAAVSAWETREGGGMVTAGVGGPITGRGADCLVIDDPIKNAEEAASPVIREKVWEWWQTTARTRMEPGGSIIIVMTRWDVDDLVGRLAASRDEQWRVVTLPALDDNGEPLWAERYDRLALDRLRREVGEDGWASLYQQHPNPQGRGLYFDMEAVSGLEAGVLVPEQVSLGGAIAVWKPRVIGARYVFGGDCAWGEKGAFAVVTFENFQTRDTVAEIYGRLPLDELAEQTVKLARVYNDAYGAVERNGEGAKVADKMVALGYGNRMYWHDHDEKEPKMPGYLTGKERTATLASLEEDVRRHAFSVKCRDEIAEMRSFVRDEKGKPVPRPGTYSDHIMARNVLTDVRQHARYGMDGGKVVVVASRWGRP